MNLFSCLDYQSLPTSHLYSSSPSLFSQTIPLKLSNAKSFIEFSSQVQSSSLFPLPSPHTPTSDINISPTPSLSLANNSIHFFPPPSILLQKAPKKATTEKKRKKWTSEEDELVLLLVGKYGRMWAFIASFLEGRTGKQIRERYFNQLDPKIIKSKFTTQEDEKIWKLYEQFGPKWLHISSFFEGRTENSIKNRYYSFLRKTFKTKEEPISNEELKMKKKMKLEEREEGSTQESIVEEVSFII